MILGSSPNKSSASVLVTNADAMTARLLVADLRRQHQFHILECEPDETSILRCITENSPDVLLISANMAGDAIFERALLRRIRSENPYVRTIVLVEKCERQLVTELFRAGAKGIFDRSEYNLGRLARCIRCVAAGEVWANRQQITFVLDAFAETASLQIVTAKGATLLTKREKDVVRLVAGGFGNRAIAEQLNLSEHTVKNYLFNIFDKLGISSRSELVMYAFCNSDNRVLHAEL